MSKKSGNTYTLQEILALTDEELTTNWSRLGSLIRLYEGKEWKDAKTLAIDLFKEDRAMDYVQTVRDEIASKRTKKSSPTKSKKSKNSKKAKVVPINSKRDRFSMNYKRLTDLIPDLISRLENGEEIHGKATNTGYMDLNIELLDRDKKGYYLSLTHYYTQNGDLVPDPDMEIFVDPKNQVVFALAFQNAYYHRSVYDDKYKRTLTNTKEENTQNSFLKTWLENLKNQGHEVEWKHDEDQQQSKRETFKPNISFIPKTFRDKLKSIIDKTSIDQIEESYINHKEGTKLLSPIALFYMAERINANNPVQVFPYPSQKEIKTFFDSLIPEDYHQTFLELNNEIEKTKKSLVEFDTSIFFDNYKLLLKIAPSLNKQLDNYGTDLHGRSIKTKLLYDLVLKAPEKTDEGYKIMLVEAKETGQKKVIDEHFAMELHFAPGKKEVRALLTYLTNGEVENVYPQNEDDVFDQDARLIEQNKALNSWLTELSESGHLIEWHHEKSEVIDEYNNEKPNNEEAKEIEETVKYWKKLAAYIQNTENISPEKAKEKALELKKEGKAEQYILKGANRYQKINKNQVLKGNFQKLLRLIPNLFSLKMNSKDVLILSSESSKLIYAQNLGVEGKFTTRFSLKEDTYNLSNWTILVQKTGRKVYVESFMKKQKKIETTSLDEEFGSWLDSYIESNYQINSPLSLLVNKAPIVLNYAYRNEYPLGFNSIKELENHFKSYEGLVRENRFNIPTRVIFKGYKSPVAITLSEKYFNPLQSEQSLEDWLTAHDPNFDWGQFNPEKEEKEKHLLLLEKYPIVIEFSEGSSNDDNTRFNTLQELQEKLKTYDVPPKGKGYIKVYVWFRGYKHSIRIDLSKTKGDFNPNQSELSLEEWLTKYDSNFEWGKFNDKISKNQVSQKKKRERSKKLQKEVDKIPDFEIGKVKWTKLHQKHGVTKKQIAWINKHKQGLIITPLGKSKIEILGNTKDVISDFNKQAMPFGKRLSRTGRIYYETRSNRADVTNSGL